MNKGCSDGVFVFIQKRIEVVDKEIDARINRYELAEEKIELVKGK